ncbi:hypothetical protein S245_033338, partial [Arachis hypogaea]
MLHRRRYQPCIAVSQTSIALNFHRPCSHRSLPSHPFPVLLRRTPSIGLARIAPFQTLMCVSLFDLATSACSFPCVAVFLSSILPQLCRAYDRAAIKFRGIDADINFNVSDYDEDIKQSQHCGKNFSRMKHSRVDTSHALRSSPWFRFPYPLQWGTPVFHWKMALVMCVVSVISPMDSVSFLSLFSSGLTSVLAGLWGTGTGSTTITENVHTIAVTKMGSRRAVQLGACFLIVLSLVVKVGGFIASIPDVIVSGLLCFMWAMLTALGLSNLWYSEAGSSRNIIIVGLSLSLFFSLSISTYFQQYGLSPNSNMSVPNYFQPYVVASHGPIQSKNGG